jgi:hypothetical protein
MRLTAATVAIVVVLTIPVMMEAKQGRGSTSGSAPQTSSRTPELKTVLHNAADALGMLRTEREADLIATVRYWGTGTMMMAGQVFKVTNYAGSVNFHVPGMRIDITRTAPDGMSQRAVEVVSDKFAWNETQPGINPTPAAGIANARLLQIWMLPQGVVKAATAAGAAANVAAAGGVTTLTFPIASIGATLKATIDDKNFIREVEARMGTSVITTTYSDYGDWNGADYLSDVMFPRHIVQKRDGATVLDLTISKTNTYNPYVVMPVPENVEKAGSTAQAASR